MNNQKDLLYKNALQLSKEVVQKFKRDLNIEPIIGGSLGLILCGYIPHKYKDNAKLDFNDVDVILTPSYYSS